MSSPEAQARLKAHLKAKHGAKPQPSRILEVASWIFWGLLALSILGGLSSNLSPESRQFYLDSQTRP